ncbi:MAG: hypothetical protein O3C32_09415 [Bacteroidetes bacterium]|nr:hypothetical protein [Bacteroidota bacterium]
MELKTSKPRRADIIVGGIFTNLAAPFAAFGLKNWLLNLDSFYTLFYQWFGFPTLRHVLY